MGDSRRWAAEQEELEYEERRVAAEKSRQDMLAALREKNKSNRPTLKENNSSLGKVYEALAKYPRLNGISCNDCGAELYDTDGETRLSYPPQTAVNCGTCGFRGFRVI